jgi:hypothetical protein
MQHTTRCERCEALIAEAGYTASATPSDGGEAEEPV